MNIHSSFIRNIWISTTPNTYATLPFTYPHVLTLLTSNSLLSMMIAWLASVLQMFLTYPHVPDETRINSHQSSYLVKIHLIFVFPITFLQKCKKNFFSKLRHQKYKNKQLNNT